MKCSNWPTQVSFQQRTAAWCASLKRSRRKAFCGTGATPRYFLNWNLRADPPERDNPQARKVGGKPKPQYTEETKGAVKTLAVFLKATGWPCLYGIGMGTNTPARA